MQRGLWEIESTRGNTHSPLVRHLAPQGTTEPLCQIEISRGHHWRTPPKQLRGERECLTCLKIARNWKNPRDPRSAYLMTDIEPMSGDVVADWRSTREGKVLVYDAENFIVLVRWLKDGLKSWHSTGTITFVSRAA